MDNSIFRTIISFVIHAVLVVSIAWFIAYGYGETVVNSGQSMEPTIEVDDTVVIDKVTFHFRLPERYDVIAFPHPDDDSKIEIKRVIGLPGETVTISDGRIYINGQVLDDKPVFDKCTLAGLADEPIYLGKDEYFVLGDNRLASEDSRFDKMGNIRLSEITGKVWFRTAPFGRLGRIR